VAQENLCVISAHLMLMSRLQKSYRRFVIKATALPLREPENSFTVHITIRKDTGRYSDETSFESGEIFPSENEALEAGILMGKRQIDTGFRPRHIVTAEDLVGLQD
jgi:hypothetical protein